MVEVVDSPLLFPSAKKCVQYEEKSFGVLHQIMSSLSDTEKEVAWQELERGLDKFEGENGFAGTCEMLVTVGEKVKKAGNYSDVGSKLSTIAK